MSNSFPRERRGNMRFILIAFSLISLFGSLQFIFPEDIWTNPYSFFHLDRGYNTASNKFVGKAFLLCLIISLSLLFYSYGHKMRIDFEVLLLIYLILVLGSIFSFEMYWECQHRNDHHSRKQ